MGIPGIRGVCSGLLIFFEKNEVKLISSNGLTAVNSFDLAGTNYISQIPCKTQNRRENVRSFMLNLSNDQGPY